jgi:phosphoribosylanthranilate isomerase
MAINYGASALGLVSSMPSGPGVISEEKIAEIAAKIPPGVTSVLLTCRQTAAEIISQHRKCQTNAIQLCDKLEAAELAKLAKHFAGISIIQVIHVCDDASIGEALSVAPIVRAILLDSGNRSLLIKELGGTGRTHNWDISRKIRDRVEVPIFLAGGLNPGNVADAIQKVQPYAVDVCSSVRTEGKLDEQKLKIFMQETFSFFEKK